MRDRVGTIVLLLAMGLAGSSARGQNMGAMEGPPGNSATSGPGTSRMQTETATAMADAGTLRISFAGKSAQWTPATLAALPHTTVTVFNEHAKVNQTYSGVALIDLLTPLGVPDKPRGKDLRLYLVTQGADGYQVVYSLGEVTPDVHDATVLVADTLNGKPIAGSGPLQLVATGEKHPARWVRNLVAIRVEAAQ